MTKPGVNEKDEVVDTTDSVAEQAEHIEHRVETVSVAKAVGHNWHQRGTQLICDGDSEHYRHGVNLSPEVVLEQANEDGSLVFRNVTTGEKSTMRPCAIQK